MKAQRIAVIGGVAAGTAAAAEAKRVDPTAHVVLFEKGPHISYGACEMPMVMAGEIDEPERLIAFTPERFASERGVDVRIRTEVLSINSGSGELVSQKVGSDSEPVTEKYDKFILATGALAVRPDIPGAHDRNVFVLRQLTDLEAIQSYCQKNQVDHVVVVGGGFVGLEVADALLSTSARVTLLQSGAGPLHRHLEPEMAAMVRAAAETAGIQYRSERLVDFDSSGGAVKAVNTNAGEKIGCQMVILALGAKPNVDLGVRAGVKLGSTGGFSATDGMRTNHSNIWACGDCVEVRRVIDDARVLSPLSLTAFRTGRVAATNAARKGRTKPAEYPGLVGAQALKVFGQEIAFVGLTGAQALAAGFKPEVVTIKHRDTAGLVPGSAFITVTLVFDSVRGRLLGGQLIGPTSAAYRADILIPVIRNRGTVRDLYDLDLIYAPPFSPRLDPLLVAAKMAIRQL
jgi:NADPH-dependent 2,4-dienoyl-CoA reductase/sulfur reductase-like enzyme